MKPVRIYTAPGCVWCEQAKQLMRQKKVAFKVIDAGKPENAKALFDRTGQLGVPVIDIDGSIIVGFDRGLLDTALRMSGRTR
ncbi:glutathione S-transferase N-terminal domain-containing protein [Candidatus Woesearchaeota archaeon]|nr:glutathione S-transferase N-terminal domain-containing protein [Candidatus Woesearchaeota archaeon]